MVASVKIVLFSHVWRHNKLFSNFPLNIRDQYLGSDVNSEVQKYRFQVTQLARNQIWCVPRKVWCKMNFCCFQTCNLFLLKAETTFFFKKGIADCNRKWRSTNVEGYSIETGKTRKDPLWNDQFPGRKKKVSSTAVNNYNRNISFSFQ
jgi:hypothetical protein